MSSNLAPRQLRAGIACAAMALMGAAVYWAALPAPPISPAGERPREIASHPAAINRVSARDARPVAADFDSIPAPAPEAPDTEEATVAQYTSEKYRLLLDDLRGLQGGGIEQLRRDLTTRERLAGELKAAREANDPMAGESLSRQEAALAKVEDRIRAVLHPADHATYESLKDSDLELYKLDDYAGGVSNVAPLSAADRNSILRTKLACKGRYRQALQDSGLMRENLSPAEREYAYSVTSRALEEYRRSYLQEVRQFLSNDEQYALLSNYENSEFEAELARLRTMANGG